MEWHFEQEVKKKLRDQDIYHLTPQFHGTLNIPERVYDYNPRFFICFNNKSERFELHSLDQPFSYCGAIPYKSLDARTIRWVWQNDLGVHGKAIFRRIEEGEYRKKKKEDREFKNWVEDVGKETRSEFAKDAWTYGT